MTEQVDEATAKERFNRLLDLIHKVSANAAIRDEETVQKVLVEEVNSQNQEYLTGRLSNNLLVHFPGDKDLIGKIINIKLKESKGFYYLGEHV